jgi:outer membrane protein assembly factor BamB
MSSLLTPVRASHQPRPTIASTGSAALALIASTMAACATGPAHARGFEVDFVSNRSEDVRAIADVLQARAVSADTATVVLTAQAPARGFSLVELPSGRVRFQSTDPIDARPTIVGDVVISHHEHEVVAFDGSSGQIRWRKRDHGFPLTGVGGDGQVVAMTLGPGGLNRRVGYVLAVDVRDGRTLFEREVEQALGVPVAAAGYVFVPWGGQYLSVFSIATNTEQARLHSTDDVFARAELEGGALYFGGRSLYRFGVDATSGRRDPAKTLRPPREDLPGQPSLTMDGYQGAGVARNARERVMISYRTDPNRPDASTTDGLVYSVFHRVLFAVDARDGSVKWGHLHDADIVGSEPVRGGLLIADEQGKLALLDATDGHLRWRAETANRAIQAVFSVPIDFAPASTEGSEPPTSPADSLLAAAGGTDTRMVPARLFATQALASLTTADATRGLIEIASRASYPQELRSAAGEALATRQQGLEHLVSALDQHYDYLRGTVAPPVGYIAQALGRAHSSSGVAPLIRHLQDPETPANDLPKIVAALREIGDSTAVPALLDFLRLYHADDGMVPQVDGSDPINDRSVNDQEAVVSAMEQAALAVFQLGSPTQKQWLQAIAVDPNTVESLRPGLTRAMTGGASTSVAATSSSGTASGSNTILIDENDPNFLPPRLTARHINEGFEPVREQLRACLRPLSSQPAQVRFSFRFDGDGHITLPIVVTPASVQDCMVPIIQSVTLRRSGSPRDIGNYYLLGAPR